MSRQSFLTAALATVLGATVGGLFFWRSLKVQRRRVPIRSAGQQEEDEEEQQEEQQHQQEEHGCVRVEEGGAPLAPVPSTEELLAVQPVVVSYEHEWDTVWKAMEGELALYPVLGLDCEWVSGSCGVSLLQMASYTGRCVLVRLPQLLSHGRAVPRTLADLLSDTRVLKVGVGTYEDGTRLSRDFGVVLTSTVDLRYLALRHWRGGLSNGLSLKSLAADVLNVPLDKCVELRCSDWEAEQLSSEQVRKNPAASHIAHLTCSQVTYAARDAQISLAIFLHLLGPDPEPVSSRLSAFCQGLVGVPFRGQADGEDRAVEGERRWRGRKLASDSSGSSSGEQQVPDPRRNRRKPLGVGYSARKSPLYDNCFLHAPDGQPLCTCDKKKAKWYLDKGIGELLSEDPFIVKLKFEPSGRPESSNDYYLTTKENLCVVCGKRDSYIRKNIVPHEYRRHFPAQMKDHNSHDILLLCTACHAASNVRDTTLKQKLADEHQAPLGCEEGVRLLEDTDRRRVRSAARALLTAGDGLPACRRQELQDLVRTFFSLESHTTVTAELLQKTASMETRIFNKAYVPHGLKVVQAYADKGLRGLMDLECLWRQHFLSTMQPRHLYPLWSVQHNHAKLLRKYGEDLPIKLT